MVHGFVRTLVKLTIASLIVGVTLTHLGVTPEKLLREFGLTEERLIELVRQAIAWAMPNLTLGALIIVPVWFVLYLFRPPRPRSE